MYAFLLLAAVFIIRRSLQKESMAHKINLKMFWVNAIAFILAVIPIVFYVIYYFTWSREFYLNASMLSLNDKHNLRKSAMVWRAIVEGGLFLSQLVWVYVLQTFGENKEKAAKPVPVEEV
jgi:heme/copper-type cytochrome/quinol oxidase subunit 2